MAMRLGEKIRRSSENVLNYGVCCSDKNDLAANKVQGRRKARIAFTTMWVAGTLGAYLTAILKTIPLDCLHSVLREGIVFDYEYTLDRVYRYGYSLWMLAYFFASNLRNQKHTNDGSGVWFDVVQSLLGFGVLIAFGFFVSDIGYRAGDILHVVGAASLAIFLICFLSLCFPDSVPPGVEILRLAGCCTAAVGAAVAYWSIHHGWAPLHWLIIMQIASLYSVLVVFVVFTINTWPVEE
jgi:hypothetical protein